MWSGRATYKFDRRTQLTLDVLNLFDRKANDIEYYYASRLNNEPPGGVADRHFHPAEPRTFRVTLVTRF
jgi:outer membrane receptor protein involved in Fe transport